MLLVLTSAILEQKLKEEEYELVSDEQYFANHNK